MQKLVIKATPKSFNVICEQGHIEFKGCSVVNDPKVFFKPVRNWIDEYLKNLPEETLVSLKIDYADSASIRYIYEILQSLGKVSDEKKSIKVNWYYEINDPEILEIGEILAGRVKAPFSFIKSYSSDFKVIQ